MKKHLQVCIPISQAEVAADASLAPKLARLPHIYTEIFVPVFPLLNKYNNLEPYNCI